MWRRLRWRLEDVLVTTLGHLAIVTVAAHEGAAGSPPRGGGGHGGVLCQYDI